MHAGSLITIARYTNPLEAHIAKGRLESEGIAAFVTDENLIWANWMLSDAIGGIPLRVAAEDSADARTILNTPIPADTLNDAAEFENSSAEEPLPACPACGAKNCQPVSLFARLAFLSIVLINLPLPFSRQLNRCNRCGHVRLDQQNNAYSYSTLFNGIMLGTLLLVAIFFLLLWVLPGTKHPMFM